MEYKLRRFVNDYLAPPAAVIALATMSGHPAAEGALRTAAADSDADVRAYARRAYGSPAQAT